MTIDDFHRQLRETGGYRTPTRAARSPIDRLFGRFDAWYYFKILQVVRSGSRSARRGTFDRHAWALHAYGMLQAVEACRGTVEVSGLRLLTEWAGPRVFASNHMSMLETFLLPGFILPFMDVATVVKRSLLEYPLFGAILRAIDPISLTRRNPREDLKTVFEEGTRDLENGRSILLFPQSTRRSVFNPAEFNTMAVKLARRAGVALMPVAVKTDFHGAGRILKDVGPVSREKTVHVRFAQAIPVAAGERDAHRKTVSFISGCLREWGGSVADPRASGAKEEAA